ncbi:hypothetical protein N7493_003896 [Penicillium malachiteum]|uniref:Rhodopsin domain-containing protein n=1 Tax=Penicillium malachiteum TaxID=1324776 RepID=A0AAD6HQH6_9EURO|nr:hypothetical protein N7493_003896 [Penicillium malachiteum]
MAGTSTPPGMIPPLTVDNETNHSGLLAIITSFTIFLVLGSLGIRVYSAYSRHVRGKDDLFFGFIVIVALAQASAASIAIHLGWGQTATSISNKDEMNKAIYASDILYVALLGLSKASTTIFYRTITMRSAKCILYALLTVIALWEPTSIVLASVRCGSRPWNDIDSSCSLLFSRWQVIAAIDVILEVSLILYPIQVIQKLQTSLSKKLIVIAILGCRVILIPLSAVHLYYMHRQFKSSDPILAGTAATVVAEIHVALSILVLIAPVMKPFIAAYVDSDGLAYTDDVSKSRSPHHSRSWTLKGAFSSRGRDPYLWTQDESPPGVPASSNRILKSVHICVDRRTLELSPRNTVTESQTA